MDRKKARQYVLNILKNDDGKVLIVGENEYYKELEEYSITIDYTLSSEDISFDTDITVHDVQIINNLTNEEVIFDGDDEIGSALLSDANIENWEDGDLTDIDLIDE